MKQTFKPGDRVIINKIKEDNLESVSHMGVPYGSEGIVQLKDGVFIRVRVVSTDQVVECFPERLTLAPSAFRFTKEQRKELVDGGYSPLTLDDIEYLLRPKPPKYAPKLGEVALVVWSGRWLPRVATGNGWEMYDGNGTYDNWENCIPFDSTLVHTTYVKKLDLI